MKAFLLLLCILFISCRKFPPYYCRDVRDCTYDAQNGEAICVYDGETGMYCAYSDRRCPSGFRFWEGLSGPASNKCVDPQLLPKDGGAD
jgi:hypothetical protein